MRYNRSPSGVCQHCNVWHPSVQMDHIVPVGMGGAHDLGNIQWLCHACHVEKGKADHKKRMAEDPEYAAMRRRNARAMRAKQAAPFTDKQHTEASKEKMRQAKLGKKRGPRTEEERQKIREGILRHYAQQREMREKKAAEA